MNITVNPIITRGYSYGMLIPAKGYGRFEGILLRKAREVLRLRSVLSLRKELSSVLGKL